MEGTDRFKNCSRGAGGGKDVSVVQTLKQGKELRIKTNIVYSGVDGDQN